MGPKWSESIVKREIITIKLFELVFTARRFLLMALIRPRTHAYAHLNHVWKLVLRARTRAANELIKHNNNIKLIISDDRPSWLSGRSVTGSKEIYEKQNIIVAVRL